MSRKARARGGGVAGSEERFRLVVETIAEVFWVSDLKWDG